MTKAFDNQVAYARESAMSGQYVEALADFDGALTEIERYSVPALLQVISQTCSLLVIF